MSVLGRVPPDGTPVTHVVYEVYIDDFYVHTAFEDKSAAEREAERLNEERRKRDEGKIVRLRPESHYYGVQTIELVPRA